MNISKYKYNNKGSKIYNKIYIKSVNNSTTFTFMQNEIKVKKVKSSTFKKLEAKKVKNPL